MAEAVGACVVRPHSRYLEMSWVLPGFRQGLHCSTGMQRLESHPSRSVGRSRNRSLRWSARSSGVSEVGVTPTARIWKGTFQFMASYIFVTITSVSFLAPWWVVEAEL